MAIRCRVPRVSGRTTCRFAHLSVQPHLPALLRADRVARPARHRRRPALPGRRPRLRHRRPRLHRRRAVPVSRFLLALCRRAAELGFRFDKIMTNGVWHRDAAHLEAVLGELADAASRGKLGLSVDKFHGSHTPKLAEFCRDGPAGLRPRQHPVAVLRQPPSRPGPGAGATPGAGAGRGRRVVGRAAPLSAGSPDLTMTLNWNHLAPVERAERFTGAWDGDWFEEDYCEGPGQALIVTPRGEVKPCCGFASDLDQLTIGNIHHDTVAEIVRARPAASLCRQGVPRGADGHPRRDPGPRPGRRCRGRRRTIAISAGTFSPRAFSIGRATTLRTGRRRRKFPGRN